MATLTFNRLLLVTFITFTFVANHAYSATILYRFEGQVLDAGLGGIPDGTAYSGKFSYESDSPNLGTIPNIGVYEYNFFEITIGTDTIFADLPNTAPGTPPRISVNNDISGSLDQLSIVANPAAGTVGTYASVRAFSVSFSGVDVFNDISLPGTDLTRDDFQFADMSVLATLSNGVAVNFQGTVDSLQAIPAPASIWLFATGATGLISMARRRKAG